MDIRRLSRRAVALLIFLWLPWSAYAANHTVTINGNSFSPDEITVAVGDTVTFRNQSGGLHNAQSDPGAPNTFRCARGCDGDGAGGNGAPSNTNWTAVVTLNNPGQTGYFCFVHGDPGGIGMSGTIFVTGQATAPPIARDDLVRLRIGAPTSDIAVLANDAIPAADMIAGSLSIIAPPAAGSASVFDNGTPTNASDDRIRYTLPAGVAVDTTIGYRACNDEAACDDGQLRILARALHDDDLALDVTSDAGFVDIPLTNLPALPGARYEPTPLVIPFQTQQTVPVDTTPGTPWDNNRQGTMTVLGALAAPVDALPQAWVIVADASPVTAGNADLFIGADLDNDNTPDENELRCTSAMTTGVERCELSLDHPGTGIVRYWVMAQNRGAGAVGIQVERAEVPLRSGGAELVATGPGNLPAAATSALRVGWDDAHLLAGDLRFGLLHVRPTPAGDLGAVPLRIEHLGGEPIGRPLASGVDFRFKLSNTGTHERTYIDVPPGATRLTVTTTAAANVDLYLARPETTSFPAIQPAPARGAAVASATSASGNESLVLEPPDLVPGRWYATPVNAGAVATDVVLRATVEGTAPSVRSGSYFNPARSGHGMFVYPAGGELAILWYHYFEDGSPTWYYLQGLQPGANGAWQSPVFRGMWDGDSNVLTRVGSVTMTPSGADAFTWSFIVDGRSGSEPMAALGRGCPTVDSIQRDSSSTWFDTATAGTGYSVQLFSNYEYAAAFVYDGHGRPRYLTAELTFAGPLVATVPLEQLTGFCPLCDRTGPPTRQTIGDYVRTFDGNGKLVRIQVDGIYGNGVPGAWTGDDQVQPLGGALTVQGCVP